MNREQSQPEGKKPYQPPQLTSISLRPEEAVLGHCKILGQSPASGLSICGFICKSAGS
jgi:hypothetical protein